MVDRFKTRKEVPIRKMASVPANHPDLVTILEAYQWHGAGISIDYRSEKYAKYEEKESSKT